MKMKIIISLSILVVLVASVLVWRFIKRQEPQSDWPPEVVAKVKANKEAKEKVRATNPELFKAVSEALFKSDPIGINFEANTDEYEPEVGTIIRHLGQFDQ